MSFSPRKMSEERKGKRPDTLRPPAPGRQEAVAAPVRRPSKRPAPRETRRSTRESNDERGEGQGVFAELIRTTLDATTSAIPEPLPPDRKQRIERLIGELATAGPESDGPLREQLLKFGPEALPALEDEFPGALWVDLSRPHRPLKSARQLSALAGAMVSFGVHAVPCVARLLRATRPETRVSAALVATDLRHGELVRPLASRLQDDVPLVRQTAMVALRVSADLPEARLLRTQLLETLEDSTNKIEWRKKAAWMIGQLRDAEAVPRLIEQVGEADVAVAVRQTLLLITGTDIGRFRFRWRRWWKSNENGQRGDWLIDALDQSDEDQRRRVAAELVLLTGKSFDPPDAVSSRKGARKLGESYRALLGTPEG